MTLAPHQIGDNSNHRYVVQARGWPNAADPEWQNCVYCADYHGALKALASLKHHPAISDICILDRVEGDRS